MKKNDFYAGHYTAPEFNDTITSNKGAILVCGSCEQHGYHMPLDTDNIIGFELALRIAEKTDMLVMPPVTYGQVWSAKGFPGTAECEKYRSDVRSQRQLPYLKGSGPGDPRRIWLDEHLAFPHGSLQRADG